jgi:hypothetical protein
MASMVNRRRDSMQPSRTKYVIGWSLGILIVIAVDQVIIPRLQPQATKWDLVLDAATLVAAVLIGHWIFRWRHRNDRAPQS